MRHAAIVVLLGAALALGPYMGSYHPLAVGMIAVAVGVALSMLCSESDAALPMATGSLGAMGFVIAWPHVPIVAGAVFVCLVFAGRGMRARTRRTMGLHTAISLVAGALGIVVISRYALADNSTRIAAVVVAGILASLPLLVAVDDVITAELVSGRAWLNESTRTSIDRLIEMRRRAAEEEDPRLTTAAMASGWKALVETVRARMEASVTVKVDSGALGAEPSPGAKALALLDARIVSHVDALERSFVAAGTARAFASGMNEGALSATRAERDSLEDEAHALAQAVAETPDAEKPAVKSPKNEIEKAAGPASEQWSSGAD